MVSLTNEKTQGSTLKRAKFQNPTPISQAEEVPRGLVGVAIKREYEIIVVPKIFSRIWIVHTRGWVGVIGVSIVVLSFGLFVFSVLAPVYNEEIHRVLESDATFSGKDGLSNSAEIKWSDFSDE